MDSAFSIDGPMVHSIIGSIFLSADIQVVTWRHFLTYQHKNIGDVTTTKN